MNTERAEFRPRILPSWLPREVRVSTLGYRLFLASILASASATAFEVAQRFSDNIPAAEAADPNCRVGVRIESYLFFDMAQVLPEMGRRHIIDMGIDPRAGSTAGFTVDAVPISYKAGDREKPGYKPLASTNIVRDQQNNVGRGELTFTTSCNTTTVTSEGKTVPAVKFKLTSNLEDNDQFEVVAGDGRRVPVFFGSEIKKLEDFLRIADEKPQIVKDLTPETKEKLRQSIKQAIATATSTPRPVSSPTPTPTPEGNGGSGGTGPVTWVQENPVKTAGAGLGVVGILAGAVVLIKRIFHI